MAEQHFDPYTRVRTIHDLPADEVISTLQKEIRRGNVENACLIAYEMIQTSADLERFLWDRLAIISVEDVGFGEVLSPVVIDSLERLSQRFGRSSGDRYLFATHAVRYLATRFKDRTSCDMYSWMEHKVEKEGLRPTIPDYAIDMHTARGIAMGRKERHFMEIAAKLNPELPNLDNKYRDDLMEIWKE